MLSALTNLAGPLSLPVVSAGGFAYLAWKRRPGDWAHPARSLSLLYLALALASLVTPANAQAYLRSELTWGTMAGYSALLLLALAPSLAITRPRARAVVMNPFVAPAARWAWVPAGFALVYLTPSALRTFERGFADTRELLNRFRGAPVPEGPLTTLAVAISMFYLCFAILAFASRVRRLGTTKTGACAVGVGLAAVHGSAFGARDGVLWAGFAVLFAYWVTQPLAPRRTSRWGKAAAMAAAIGAVAYLGLATKDRFEQESGGYAGGTLMYFGAQPYVFEETVQRTTDYFGFALRFPLLTSGDGYVERTEVYQWSFGTFLADFFGVGGWPYAVGLTLGGVVLIWAGLRACRARSELAYVLLAGLYAQFMVQGAFYFRLGNRPGNIYHLLMVGAIGMLVLFLPDRQTDGWRRRGLLGMSEPAPVPVMGPLRPNGTVAVVARSRTAGPATRSQAHSTEPRHNGSEP